MTRGFFEGQGLYWLREKHSRLGMERRRGKVIVTGISGGHEKAPARSPSTGSTSIPWTEAKLLEISGHSMIEESRRRKEVPIPGRLGLFYQAILAQIFPFSSAKTFLEWHCNQRSVLANLPFLSLPQRPAFQWKGYLNILQIPPFFIHYYFPQNNSCNSNAILL